MLRSHPTLILPSEGRYEWEAFARVSVLPIPYVNGYAPTPSPRRGEVPLKINLAS